MKQGKPITSLKRIGLWCLGALIAATAGSGLVAWLVLQEIVSEAQGPLLAQLLAAMLLFLASFFAVKNVPDHRLIYALGMGALFIGLGLLLRAGLGAGEGISAGGCLLPIVSVIVAGLLANRRPIRRRR